MWLDISIIIFSTFFFFPWKVINLSWNKLKKTNFLHNFRLCFIHFRDKGEAEEWRQWQNYVASQQTKPQSIVTLIIKQTKVTDVALPLRYLNEKEKHSGIFSAGSFKRRRKSLPDTITSYLTNNLIMKLTENKCLRFFTSPILPVFQRVVSTVVQTSILRRPNLLYELCRGMWQHPLWVCTPAARIASADCAPAPRNSGRAEITSLLNSIQAQTLLAQLSEELELKNVTRSAAVLCAMLGPSNQEASSK